MYSEYCLVEYTVHFQAVVLNHIKTKLGKEEWDRMRYLAFGRDRCVPKGQIVEHYTTPEELVEGALSEEGLGLNDLPGAFTDEALEIDRIEGQPVYFVADKGIYLWSLSPTHSPILSLWLTFPAYPPGW